MANPGNAVQTLNGLFKDRYSDKVKDLVPDHVKLYNAVKFDTSKKIGKSYNEPVILSLESGFTYGGDGSLFDLNDVKEFKMENAEIKARELVLRSAISIGALSRSGSSEQAIQKSMDLMVGNMLKSVYHRLEVQMFYGQSGLGEVEADSGASAASVTISIKDYSWAAGVWNGTSGAEVEIFNAAIGVKRGIYVIEGYSLKNKTITISRADAAPLALDEILTDDIIFFKGAAAVSAVKNEFLGVHEIATESVNLFGIANTNEPLFQGSIVDVGTDATTNAAVISFEKIEDGIAAMVEKGLMEEEVCCYVNPKQWNDLLTEQDAKRVHDSSYSPSKMEKGSRDIVFHGQNGTVKIKPSTFVKQGFSYLIVEKDLKRIGSSEVSFKRPDGQDYLELLEGKNGIEMRCYTDQALFTARPASLCVLQYIKSE